MTYTFMKHLIQTSKRINRGIGYDTFLINYKGKRYILRIENNSSHSKLKIERHQYFLRLFRKECFVQQIFKKGVINNKNYFITNFINGKNITNFTKKASEEFEKILYKIHMRHFLGSGKFDIITERGGHYSWYIYLQEIINKIQPLKSNILLKNKIIKINQEFNMLKNLIENRIANRLLHFDLNKENILMSDNSNIIILDWENTAIGDPLADYPIMDNFWFPKMNFLRQNIKDNELKIFLFYKKIFFLLEIFYKLKYNRPVGWDIRKIQKFQ